MAGFLSSLRPSNIYARFIKGLISRGFFGDVLNSGQFAPISIEGNTIFQEFDPEKAIDLVRESATAYTCYRKISKKATSVKWMVRNKADKEVNETHDLNRLIARPHPLYSWKKQNSLIIFHQISIGDHYLRKNVVNNGTVIQWLEPVSPINIGIIPSRTDFIAAYEFQGSGTSRFRIPREEIIHFRFDIDPKNAYFGLSPTQPITKVIQTDDSALEFQKFGLDNRSGKGLVFMMNKHLSDKQFLDITARMRTMHQGAKNNGSPYLLGKDFTEVDEVGEGMKELEMTDSRRKLQEEICGAIGVPYVLINPTDATFANMEEANKEFIDETIVPTLEGIKEELNNGILDVYPDVFLDYDSMQIQEMRGELKTKSETATRFFQMGYTRNEANDRLGLGFDGDKKDGDISYIPANLIPAIEAGLLDEDEPV